MSTEDFDNKNSVSDIENIDHESLLRDTFLDDESIRRSKEFSFDIENETVKGNDVSSKTAMFESYAVTSANGNVIWNDTIDQETLKFQFFGDDLKDYQNQNEEQDLADSDNQDNQDHELQNLFHSTSNELGLKAAYSVSGLQPGVSLAGFEIDDTENTDLENNIDDKTSFSDDIAILEHYIHLINETEDTEASESVIEVVEDSQLDEQPLSEDEIIDDEQVEVISDVNDSAQTFTSGSSVSASENVNETTVLYTATATDEDTTGETIFYSLIDDAGGLFEINSSTGEVTLVSGQSLDYERTTSHNIIIQSSDGTNTTDHNVTINVSDVAETIQLADGGDTFTDSGIVEVSIVGGSGDDIITGHSGDDTIAGGYGDDVVYAGDGDDRFDDSATNNGNDTLNMGAGDDTAIGGDGNDIIDGGSGDDTLLGEDDDDIITGGSGNDTIRGGSGDDIVIFSGNRSDYDIAYSHPAEAWTLIGPDGTDTVFEVETFRFADGDILAASLMSTSDQTIYGTDNTETINGGSGDDTISGREGDDIINAGEGDDRFDDFSVGNGNDMINMGAGDDIAYGGDGTDTISGGTGNDTLSGENGNDIIDGGDGNDAINGGAEDDTITGGAGNDTIEGSSGTDTAIYSGNWSDYTITLSSGAYTIVDNRSGSPDGTDTVSGIDSFQFADGTVDVSDLLNVGPTDIGVSVSSIDENSSDGTVVATLSATDANALDSHTYSMTSDTSGFFEIVGNEVRVKAGANLDYETASSHNITVEVTDSFGSTYSEIITVNVTDTNDVGQVFTSGVTGTGGENISDTTVVYTATTTDADTTGESITYSLTNDAGGLFEINSSTGEVTLASGQSLDYESATSHNITIQSSDGTNTTDHNVTINVSDQSEAYTLPFPQVFTDTSVAEVSITGTSGGDTINGTNDADTFYGGDGGDTLVGNDGNDIIYGEAGNDVISGGAGNDTLNGGTGNDGINGGSGNDTIIGSSGSDVMDGGTGTDTLDYSSSTSGIALAFQDTDGSGISGAYINQAAGGYTGDASGDSFSNFETFTGTDYNDEVYGDDSAMNYNLGGGNDTFDTGTTTTVDTIYGGDGSDKIFSGEGDDYIEGGSGNDYLFGEGGSDTLDGGAGIDTASYKWSSSGVSVDLSTGSGTLGDAAGDTLTNIENLTGTEYYNDTLTGDTGDNVIDGRGGADDINGGGGNDTLTGGAGNDTIDGGTGTDTVIYTGNWSDYTITESSGTYTIVDNRGGSPDGTDTVTGVENFQFADGTLSAADVPNMGPTDIVASSDTIAENSGLGTVIATLSETDNNALDSHTFAITSDPSGFFEIVGNQLQVASGASLDYETATSHNVTVEVTDAHGSPYSEVITINVTDTNDVGQVFTSGATGSGAENINDTTVVYTATTSDVDTTGESITYSLTDNAGGLFEIDSSTGEVTLASGQSLDYETATSHNITIQSSDGINTTDQSVTINVTDSNDFGQVFTSGTTGSGAENINDTTVVYTAATTDADTTGEGITYSLTDNAGGLFEINSSTGEVTLASGQSLDYETANSHNITIQSSDGTNTTDHNVTINVTDISENIQLADSGETFTDAGISELSVNGGIGSDTITGTNGNDTLSGGGSNDTLTGGDGNDNLEGGSGLDTLYGGAGIDTIEGGADHDEIYGGSGNDIINDTGGGHDELYGEAGDDTINAGAGWDIIDGGADIDTAIYSGNWSDYTITENSGTYTIADNRSGAPDGTDTVSNVENFQFADGTVGIANLLTVGPIDIEASGGVVDENSVTGTVVATLSTTAGTNTLDNYTYTITNDPSGFFEIVGNEVRVASGASLDYETVTSHSITIQSSDGINTTDQIITITVDDIAEAIYLSNLGETLIDTGVAETVIFGGTGNDDITAHSNGGNILGGDGADTITGSGSSDTLRGQDGNDIITGGDGSDYLYGNDGNDNLSGGNGSDILIGGEGADILDGGSGTDTVSYSSSISGVTVNLASGGTSGDALGDTYTKIENVNATSYDDVVTGDDESNRIDAYGGNDILDGAGGNDTLYGNDGNDNLVGGAGDDYLHAGGDDDTLSGGAGDDRLWGDNGTDTAVYSGNWSDYTITENSGIYTIVDNRSGSPDGTDIVSEVENFQFADGTVSVSDLLNVAPTDIALTAGSAAITTGTVETAVVTGEIVSSGFNQSVDHWAITHNGGDLTVDIYAKGFNGSSLDSDTYLFRDNGDDTYTLIDSNDDGQAGSDGSTSLLDSYLNVSSLSAGNYILAIGEWGSLNQTNALNTSDYPMMGTGGGEYQITISGDVTVSYADNPDSSGNPWGDPGSNAVVVDGTGGAGGDVIAASTVVATASGVDADTGETFSYSLTDDSGGKFSIDADGDISLVAEHDASSIFSDTVTVRATDSGSLTYDEVIGIKLGTNSVDTITGTSNSDVIYGFDGDDTLSGSGGDDIIIGGAGADTIDGGTGTDTVDYSSSSSAVTVNLTTGTNTGGDAQGDILTAIENIIGSANADNLTGDTGDNQFTGGAGNDVLVGSDGNDSFFFLEGHGTDSVDGGNGVSWTDSVHLADPSGGSNLGTYGVDWTVSLTEGSISTQTANQITLTQDADGTITLQDGSHINFTDIEEIHY